MPAVIRSFAKTYAERHDIEEEEAFEELEALWERAKTIAEKKGLELDSNEFYAYVMGIWKRMSGYETASESSSHMVQISLDL